MELNNLPIIDWELGTKLAGNRTELAEEMLGLVISGLPNDVSAINHLYTERNFNALLQKVHKLHGALCYCGLPRLKTVVARLETALKNNILSNLFSLLNQLHAEVNLLLEHYSLHSSRCSGQENG